MYNPLHSFVYTFIVFQYLLLSSECRLRFLNIDSVFTNIELEAIPYRFIGNSLQEHFNGTVVAMNPFDGCQPNKESLKGMIAITFAGTVSMLLIWNNFE
jgi:hypothetical protein